MAIIFDFDLTLGPGSLDALLQRCGWELEGWKQEHVSPLVAQGWEEILATAYALVHATTSSSQPRITREFLREIGRSLTLYAGVPAMFSRLRESAKEVLPVIEVELYLLSSGFLDIIRAAGIAEEFQAMWGTELHFDESGALAFPKLIVTHPEKARYVLALSKGLDPRGPNAPAHVYRKVEESNLHVPLDQIIYVGDGRSDMSVFRLLSDGGGLAIGVRKPQNEEWSATGRTDPDRRVQNLTPPDFTADSELMRSLRLAVGSIGRKIALRRLSRGE